MSKLTLSQLSNLLFRAGDDLRGNMNAFWNEVDKVLQNYLRKNGAGLGV